MSSDLIRCCICLVDYDLEEHIPVMLSQCGHNTCQSCADYILKSHNRECPICRKSFPNVPNHTMYVPNRHIRERLEREGEYQSCKVHEGRLLEFYCKTDKCKVCIDCCFDKGEQSHRGHDVEQIADLKDEIDSKRKVFEEHLESCRMTNEDVKNIVQKKKQELLHNNKELERVADLIALETSLRVREMFNEEEEKANKICGEDSDIMKEIQAKVLEYKNIKTADIRALLEENPEEFTKKLDNSKVQEYLQSLNNHIELPATPVVVQDSNKISNLTSLKLNGYLRVELNADELSITASDVLNKNITLIDLTKYEREVKKFKVAFDKFNFNDEDLQVIRYLWNRLQPHVDSVDISYQDTPTISEVTLEQEEHLIDFPRMIFSNSQTLKSIGLSFSEIIPASGLAKKSKSSGFADRISIPNRYMKFLLKKVLPQSPNLTSLSLGFVQTNFDGSLLSSIIQNLNSRPKELTHLSLTLDPVCKSMFSPLKLPSLKSFKFSTNANVLAQTVENGFLCDSLNSMTALEECELILPNAYPLHLIGMFSLFRAHLCLKKLKIDMPNVQMLQSESDKLISELKSHLKDLQTISVNITYLPPPNQPVETSVFGGNGNARSGRGGQGLFGNQSQTQSSASSSVFNQQFANGGRDRLYQPNQSFNTSRGFSSNPFIGTQSASGSGSNAPRSSGGLFANNQNTLGVRGTYTIVSFGSNQAGVSQTGESASQLF